jgi:hypothetical protein
MNGSRLEATGTALLLLALISVPTASENVRYPDKRVSDSPIISSETTTDIQVSLDTETASTAKIEKHNSVYRVQQTPSKRVETLTTPQGVLKKIRTQSSKITKVETPYGTITTGIENGRKVSRFRGANSSMTRKLLEELRSRSETYRSRVKQEMLPEIEARILRNRADDPEESIKIDNEETESISLEGWTLVNSEGDRYSFQSLEIPATGQAVMYTKSEDELNVTEKESIEYVYGTGVDWDQTGDEASLFNIRGVEVASDSYS